MFVNVWNESADLMFMCLRVDLACEVDGKAVLGSWNFGDALKKQLIDWLCFFYITNWAKFYANASAYKISSWENILRLKIEIHMNMEEFNC